MAGIYIHIPFCKQACTYCDFHFSTQQQHRQPLINALCKEISNRFKTTKTNYKTLYFGGGSPSILNQDELQQIFQTLSQHIDLSKLEEITLESNPDDHTPEKLQFWRSLGIDRLSIGIQSFIDRDLQLMNRAHDADQAQHCVAKARDAGFKALTIDLIYGIPDQSYAEWLLNIEQALALNVDHISAYCLTIEERTVLHHQRENGEIEEVNDEVIEQQYIYLHRMLENQGYEHYEISNFSKPGRRALHNRSYWSGAAYIGIGPAAHSFDGVQKRRWNIANNAQYIKAVETGTSYWESETLTASERCNEILITGLRTKDGVALKDLAMNHRKTIKANFMRYQAAHPDQVSFENNTFQIRPEAWLMTDGILKEILL